MAAPSPNTSRIPWVIGGGGGGGGGVVGLRFSAWSPVPLRQRAAEIAMTLIVLRMRARSPAGPGDLSAGAGSIPISISFQNAAALLRTWDK